jgi:hypothetical protein
MLFSKQWPCERNDLKRHPAAGDAIGQAPTRKQSHYQVEVAVLFTKVMHGDNRVVFERRDRTCLALEAHPEGRIATESTRKHFDGDFAAEAWVPRAIDGGHSAAAKFAAKLVSPVVLRHSRILTSVKPRRLPTERVRTRTGVTLLWWGNEQR